MSDPPPSPSGSSTAVPASPLRTQRGQRLERGPSGALLLPISNSGSPSQQPARGPSRGKWLLLQACFLLLLLASAALLFTESKRTAWVSQLLQRSTNSTTLPAFQVSTTRRSSSSIHLPMAICHCKRPPSDSLNPLWPVYICLSRSQSSLMLQSKMCRM